MIALSNVSFLHAATYNLCEMCVCLRVFTSKHAWQFDYLHYNRRTIREACDRRHLPRLITVITLFEVVM